MPSRRRSGFTVLELMVVIAVISILTAMIVPQFGGSYRHALLRSSARRLVAVLQLASSQAVTTGRLHRLRIDPADGRWWLEARADGGERLFEPLQGVPGSAGRIEQGLRARLEAPGEATEGSKSSIEPEPDPEKARGAGESIQFRVDGTSEPRQIVLETEDGFAIALRIHPTTSRVRVVEVDGPPGPGKRGGA